VRHPRIIIASIILAAAATPGLTRFTGSPAPSASAASSGNPYGY
jgi:hypothetical protein